MRYVIALLLILTTTRLYGHELIPTYPELRTSYIEGVLTTTLVLFNKREDVKYYQISVFDKEWNPIEFATGTRVIEVEYEKKVSFDVYIRSKDRKKATYICTESKILKQQQTTTIVSSRICSKLK